MDDGIASPDELPLDFFIARNADAADAAAHAIQAHQDPESLDELPLASIPYIGLGLGASAKPKAKAKGRPKGSVAVRKLSLKPPPVLAATQQSQTSACIAHTAADHRLSWTKGRSQQQLLLDSKIKKNQ